MIRRYHRVNVPSTSEWACWFVVQSDQSHILDAGVSRKRLADDALAWVEEHAAGKWSFSPTTDIFMFVDERDAFAFQMRWC